MADVKISALPAVVTPAGTDEFAVNQAGTTKKLTLTQVLAANQPGSFSTLASAGDLTMGADALASALAASLNTAAGQVRRLRFLSAGLDRWRVQANATAEGGSDAGSDFEIAAYDDTGSLVGTALTFTRADLSAVLGGTLRATAVGIGAAPDAGIGLLVAPSSTLTGTTQVGVDGAAIFGSAATALGVALRAQLKTAAASFTMTQGAGVWVLDASKGAGSTITTQYGIYVVAQTQGATNYGVYVANNKSFFGGEVEVTGDLNHSGTDFGFSGTTPSAPQTGYTTFTNLSTDRTCDADTVAVAELADIVGTLIEDLKAKGIISA